MMLYTVAVIVVLLFALATQMFKVLREYERGVVFFLGRFQEVKGPGLIILIPFIQQMVRVDLRTVVLDVPTQDLITKDNVSVRVNAVVYFRVVDPQMAINNIESYSDATSQLAQTTLRSVLGRMNSMNCYQSENASIRIYNPFSINRLMTGESRLLRLKSNMLI